MSVRKHPTKGDGWWHIDYLPNGQKGKRIRIPFQGTEEQAKKREMLLKSGLWEGEFENVESSFSKINFDESKGPYIYFIQQGQSGPIKIGFTKDDLYRRVKKLQTGNHIPLRLLAVIENASVRKETELHSRFSQYKLTGEWFSPSDDLIEFIKTIKSRSYEGNLVAIFKEFHKLAENIPELNKRKLLDAMLFSDIKNFKKVVNEILLAQKK